MVSQDEFLEFIAGLMRVSPSQLSLETKYQSIPEWDSVMQLRLVMELEGRYGVEFPFEKVPELKRLGDFWDVVKAG